MFKQSFKAIKILMTYAPFEASCKIIQRILMAMLTPLSIYFTQRLIDSLIYLITDSNGMGSVVLWCGLLLFSMFFKTTESFFDGILSISLRRKLNYSFTPFVVNKFKNMDYQYFEDRDTQDTIKRMSEQPQDNILSTFIITLASSSMFVVVVISSFIFGQAGIVFMLGFIALLFPMIWFDFKSQELMTSLWNEQSTEERRLSYLGGLLSSKASLFELKVFGSIDYIVQKWRDKTNIVLDERLKTTMKSRRFSLAGTLLFKAWSFLMVIFLVREVINQNITIGLFTALVLSTGTVMDMSTNLSRHLQGLKRRVLLIDHYDNFMNLPETAKNDADSKIENPHIVFDNVTFSYPKTDKPVLKGLSFEINSNERVSLVGENGAGKSTVIKLLCRLYRPTGGRIFINGTDINELSQKQLRMVYSVVFQDYCNYWLTLRENVAFGDLTKINDDNSLKRALTQGLWGDWDIGLDASLGKLEEDGRDLSGGQWQRVAIARACLADSAFVILDEPAAALDPLAECEMYKTFSQVLKNRGCIMISHRMASAKMADKIIVIDGGTATETGSHDELMSKNGLYAKMFNAQSSWYA